MAHVFVDKNYSQVFRGGFFSGSPPGGFGRKKVDATSEKKKKKRSAVESFGDDVYIFGNGER
jgi:hypothetical protein